MDQQKVKQCLTRLTKGIAIGYIVSRHADARLRISLAPPFPGLRRFKHGRNFKQWTGADSKGLMKVIYIRKMQPEVVLTIVIGLPIRDRGICPGRSRQDHQRILRLLLHCTNGRFYKARARRPRRRAISVPEIQDDLPRSWCPL